MNLLDSRIAGLHVAKSSTSTDHRGAFSRLFCEESLASVLGHRRIVQVNHSRTSGVGALRGLHYQHAPYSEMKLVRCLKGRVWDVAVDLRKGSSTFLNWHAEVLSATAGNMMIIPEGFAHGFQVMEAESELLYLHTASYNSAAEGAVRYDDPRLAISWPLPITDLSQRDKYHPLLDTEFVGV